MSGKDTCPLALKVCSHGEFCGAAAHDGACFPELHIQKTPTVSRRHWMDVAIKISLLMLNFFKDWEKVVDSPKLCHITSIFIF